MWQTPKTNWHPSNEEGIAGADLNRIEGNTEYNYYMIRSACPNLNIGGFRKEHIYSTPIIVPKGKMLILDRVVNDIGCIAVDLPGDLWGKLPFNIQIKLDNTLLHTVSYSGDRISDNIGVLMYDNRDGGLDHCGRIDILLQNAVSGDNNPRGGGYEINMRLE